MVFIKGFLQIFLDYSTNFQKIMKRILNSKEEENLGYLVLDVFILLFSFNPTYHVKNPEMYVTVEDLDDMKMDYIYLFWACSVNIWYNIVINCILGDTPRDYYLTLFYEFCLIGGYILISLFLWFKARKIIYLKKNKKKKINFARILVYETRFLDIIWVGLMFIGAYLIFYKLHIAWLRLIIFYSGPIIKYLLILFVICLILGFLYYLSK